MRQLCEYPDYRLPGREELFDRVHAGWLGEIIGSALGTAVEGFNSSRLWEVFGEIDGYVKPPETLNDDITQAEDAIVVPLLQDVVVRATGQITSEQFSELRKRPDIANTVDPYRWRLFLARI